MRLHMVKPNGSEITPRPEHKRKASKTKCLGRLRIAFINSLPPSCLSGKNSACVRIGPETRNGLLVSLSLGSTLGRGREGVKREAGRGLLYPEGI